MKIKKILQRLIFQRGLLAAVLIGNLLSAAPAVRAQDFDTTVYMTGKVWNNEVLLRWAAASPALWERAMETGWVLERYDFDTALFSASIKAGKDVAPVKVSISIPPFLQADTAQLSVMADTCPYMAVLGEAVFSSELRLTMGGGTVQSPWGKIADGLQRRELRFVMANLAYDRSFAVACMGGMGYVDRKVEAGHFYLYRLFLNTDKTLGESPDFADTALFFTRLETGEPIPPLQELRTEYGVGAVNIAWNTDLVKQLCIGYFVERCVQEKRKPEKFVRLHQTPLTVLQQNESGYMAYTDSLPDGKKLYAYRVVGVDLFGHEFPVARSKYGKSAERPVSAAVIDSVVSGTGDKLHLHWSYPEEAGRVEAFSVYVTSRPYREDASLRKLASGLPARSRSFQIDPEWLSESSYFYVQAEGVQGSACFSSPYFFWKRDSVPPAPPVGLAFTVDSAGVARITWHSSTDKDLAGYRVFRRIKESSEPVQVTTDLLQDTVFIDTLSLRTPQYFYYSVAAADRSGNLSDHSRLLAVKNLLPNKPVPPLFSRHCRKEGNHLEIVWYNSPSPETKGHLLLYKADSSAWIPLCDLPLKETGGIQEKSSFSFRLPERSVSTRYAFSVVAYGKDPATDTAWSAFPYTYLHVPVPRAPRLFAVVDADNRYVQLQWKEKGTAYGKRIFLYRRSETEPLHLLASLEGDQMEKGYYTDFSVRMNTVYTYVSQVEYEDGRWSEYSSGCKVEY